MEFAFVTLRGKNAVIKTFTALQPVASNACLILIAIVRIPTARMEFVSNALKQVIVKKIVMHVINFSYLNFKVLIVYVFVEIVSSHALNPCLIAEKNSAFNVFHTRIAVN